MPPIDAATDRLRLQFTDDLRGGLVCAAGDKSRRLSSGQFEAGVVPVFDER